MTAYELFSSLSLTVYFFDFPEDRNNPDKPHRQKLLDELEYLMSISNESPTSETRTSSKPMESWMYVAKNGKNVKKGYSIFYAIHGNRFAQEAIDSFLMPSREAYYQLCERLGRS